MYRIPSSLKSNALTYQRTCYTTTPLDKTASLGDILCMKNVRANAAWKRKNGKIVPALCSLGLVL